MRLGTTLLAVIVAATAFAQGMMAVNKPKMSEEPVWVKASKNK